MVSTKSLLLKHKHRCQGYRNRSVFFLYEFIFVPIPISNPTRLPCLSLLLSEATVHMSEHAVSATGGPRQHVPSKSGLGRAWGLLPAAYHPFQNHYTHKFTMSKGPEAYSTALVFESVFIAVTICCCSDIHTVAGNNFLRRFSGVFCNRSYMIELFLN